MVAIITALIVCMRFSASSKTLLRGLRDVYKRQDLEDRGIIKVRTLLADHEGYLRLPEIEKEVSAAKRPALLALSLIHI